MSTASTAPGDADTANVNADVIIAGAGPAGLFLAYKLAKFGINVDIVERLPRISKEPRAAGYYGAALLALKDAGLLQLAVQRGYMAKGLGWRAAVQDDGQGKKIWGNLLCYIPFGDEKRNGGRQQQPEHGMLLLPQPQLCELLEEQIHLLNRACISGTGRITFHFNAELCAIHEEEDGVTVTVQHPETGIKSSLQGTLFVGADGGKSAARSLLGIKLQGHTWPERLITADVMLRNIDLPPLAPAHFVVHPVHFAMVIPLEQPVEGETTLWRFSMATHPDEALSDDELLQDEYLSNLFKLYMVAPNPSSPPQYKVYRKTVYRVHQRLSNTMAKGRCALVGDAAHLTNPVGALGLATALLDSEALATAINMILRERHPLSVLSTYSDARRQVFQSFVSPTSTANKLRVQQEPAAAEDDWMVRTIKNATPSVLRDFFMPYMTVWRTDIRALVAVQEAAHCGN
ncbi:FAD-binding monooxygenase [Aspergillus californicus]